MESSVRLSDFFERQVEGLLEVDLLVLLGDLCVGALQPLRDPVRPLRAPTVRRGRHFSRVAVPGEDERPLHEIAVLVREDLFAELPELVPIKLGVVVLGRHDRGVEPDHVRWVVREERRDEGVGIHRPGFGDLLAAREEPLVGGNVVRELEAAGAEEHARPDDRVVELVVLADEVVLSDRLPSVPVRLPRVRTSGADCPLLRSGEIPRDGVEPDVETLRVVPVERYGHSPVEVAGDGRRVEALLEEVLRDAEGSRTPMLLMAQVLPELLLEPVELEIEVLRGPEFGRGAAKSTPRAPELTRLEGATAVVAFVSASVLEAAVRARADQVPVGKEPAVLRTVRPLGRPASDESRLEEPEEQFLDGLLVHDGVRVRVEVERETESLESVLVDRVVLFRDRKGSGLFLLGSDER